jgi:hypothetical protein
VNMSATAGKTTRNHWRKEDHVNDPIALAASLAQTGETSIADDDLVKFVNGSTTTGFRAVTRDDVNNALGSNKPGYSTWADLGIYRRGHRIGGGFRFEYYITGEDADRRRTAESRYANFEPPFLIGKDLFKSRPAKRPPQREPGQSGVTPLSKSTRSRLADADREEKIAELEVEIDDLKVENGKLKVVISDLEVRYSSFYVNSSSLFLSSRRASMLLRRSPRLLPRLLPGRRA